MSESRIRGGLYPAVITPFDEREAVDLGALRAVLEYVLGAGVDGVVIAGTTGEAHTLAAEERRALWTAAVAHVRGRMPVVAGTGATSTREALAFTRIAAECGADAALVLTPWFGQPTTVALERYFDAVAEESRLPVILYHNPSHTFLDWPVESVVAVAQRHPGRVIGLKDTTGDLARIAAIRAGVPAEFVIFAGPPHRRAEFGPAGSNGAIDDVANAIPAESVDAWHGDARQIAYVEAAAQCFRASADYIALLKATMNQLGLPAGRPRRPRDEAAPEELAEVRQRLATGGRLQASPASLMLTNAAGFTDKPAAEVTAAVHILAPGLAAAAETAVPVHAEIATVYRAEPGEYQYNHHAAIVHFQGRFFASWSAGAVNEDAPGQTVRYAVSDDGRQWSAAADVTPRPEGRLRWTAGQFWVRGDDFYCLAHRCTRARYVDGEGAPGVCWMDLAAEAFRWTGDGWAPQGVIIEDFYINEGPRALPDGTFLMTGENARHESTVARGGMDGIRDWQPVIVAPRTPTCKMSEPTWFLTEHGVVRLLMRDDGGSRRLWLSESADGGRTWTAPQATDFTDAQSKLITLNLSDGRVALVSNPSPGNLRRRLLAVAVSDDGREFTRMHALRCDPAGAARLKGMHKVPGFDYPNAVEALGRLWVTYAVNKEDIEVLSLPVDGL